MKKLYAIRTSNLRLILTRWTKKKAFADACEVSKTQLSVFLSPTNPGNIGDIVARRIETANKLPVGWMDKVHNGEPLSVSDDDLMTILITIKSVYETFHANNIDYTAIDDSVLDQILITAANNALLSGTVEAMQESLFANIH